MGQETHDSTETTQGARTNPDVLLNRSSNVVHARRATNWRGARSTVRKASRRRARTMTGVLEIRVSGQARQQVELPDLRPGDRLEISIALGQGGDGTAQEKALTSFPLVLHTRTGRQGLSAAEYHEKRSQFLATGLFVDETQRIVYVDGEPTQDVRGQAFDVLRAICQRRGRIHRDHLKSAVWEDSDFVTRSAVDKAVSRLRAQLRRCLDCAGNPILAQDQMLVLVFPTDFVLVSQVGT